MDSKEKIFKLQDAHDSPVISVRVTPDEKYIVSTAKDNHIKIWDIRQRKLVHQFEHAHFQLGSNKAKLCVSNNS